MKKGRILWKFLGIGVKSICLRVVSIYVEFVERKNRKGGKGSFGNFYSSRSNLIPLIYWRSNN